MLLKEKCFHSLFKRIGSKHKWFTEDWYFEDRILCRTLEVVECAVMLPEPLYPTWAALFGEVSLWCTDLCELGYELSAISRQPQEGWNLPFCLRAFCFLKFLTSVTISAIFPRPSGAPNTRPSLG